LPAPPPACASLHGCIARDISRLLRGVFGVYTPRRLDQYNVFLFPLCIIFVLNRGQFLPTPPTLSQSLSLSLSLSLSVSVSLCICLSRSLYVSLRVYMSLTLDRSIGRSRSPCSFISVRFYARIVPPSESAIMDSVRSAIL